MARNMALEGRLMGDDMLVLAGTGIKPIGRDKGGAKISVIDVTLSVAKQVNYTHNYFRYRAKTVSNDIKAAEAMIDESIKSLNHAYNRMMDLESKLSESSKKQSGNVRDSAEKLAQGLARIEKAANFQRLEGYVVLLERAASAMSQLAELEKTGKLEKIAAILR